MSFSRLIIAQFSYLVLVLAVAWTDRAAAFALIYGAAENPPAPMPRSLLEYPLITIPVLLTIVAATIRQTKAVSGEWREMQVTQKMTVETVNRLATADAAQSVQQAELTKNMALLAEKVNDMASVQKTQGERLDRVIDILMQAGRPKP